MKAPNSFSLAEPGPGLTWFSSQPATVDLDGVRLAEIWGLTGMAVLARSGLAVSGSPDNRTTRFATAVGLFDVIAGREPKDAGIEGRTAKLTRIRDYGSMDAKAREISRMLIPWDKEDARRTVQYVLVELWRNVVQHSQDAMGGVVAAQRNDDGRCADRPMIQVAVVDGGIGIPAHLARSHPNLKDPQAAIQKSLEPHISGTFEEGQTGGAENAGMGLFFISEITKLTAGRLLVASRGAAFSLEGDPEGGHGHDLVAWEGLGFPGTLVAFEMPAFEALDYEGIMETIKERAKERTPKRQTHRWLSFESAPSAKSFLVNIAVEDTEKATEFARRELMPLLVARQPIELNFAGLRVCTQSFAHALLFEPLRIAWALKVPIYVTNVTPAVRTHLELVENYGLSG